MTARLIGQLLDQQRGKSALKGGAREYRTDREGDHGAHPRLLQLPEQTIGGRLVVEHRRVTTVDVAGLAREVVAARRRLSEVTAPAKALYERLAPLVSRFCPGLAHVPYHVNRYVGRA